LRDRRASEDLADARARAREGRSWGRYNPRGTVGDRVASAGDRTTAQPPNERDRLVPPPATDGEAIEASGQEDAVSPLSAWANFYVVIGTSAGALTGLTFVVITLVAGRPQRGGSWGLGAFTTPTLVHFGVALLVCASLSAPWPALAPAALLLGLTGLGGAAYAAVVVRRLRLRDGYDPVPEDWLWYGVLPLVAYATLVGAALLLPGRPTPALFGVGAALVLLVFVGIHNAWDVVTYLAVVQFQQADGQQADGRQDGREE
jgi:hypothetical protein